MRKIILSLATLVLAVFTVTGLAASASAHTDAQRRVPKQLCEQYQSGYCLSITFGGNSVTEASTGVPMTFNADGGSYQGWPTGTLNFTNTGDCARGYNFLVTRDNCSGLSNIVWANDLLVNGNRRFINVAASKNHGGTDYFLVGDNVPGSEYEVLANVCGGCVSQFGWK